MKTAGSIKVSGKAGRSRKRWYSKYDPSLIKLGERLKKRAFHLCFIYQMVDGMFISVGSFPCLNLRFLFRYNTFIYDPQLTTDLPKFQILCSPAKGCVSTLKKPCKYRVFKE